MRPKSDRLIRRSPVVEASCVRRFPSRSPLVRTCLGIGLALLCSVALANAADGESETDAVPPQGEISFVGKNLIATANGTFHSWRVVDSQVDLANPESTFAVVEVDLASVDTGIERRDDHLRNPDFFEVEKYPTATVRAQNLAGKGESETGNPLYAVDFVIDLHGVRKTVPGEVEQISALPPIFEGRLEIDRTDFGVGAPASRWNPMAVKEIVPVSFRVQF